MTVAETAQRAEPPATYDGEYDGWLVQQAALLDVGGGVHVGWADVAEALLDLESAQEHRLESAFRVLMLRLLKWDFQPERRSPSWRLSILNNHDVITRLMRKSGSLRAHRDEAIEAMYGPALREAGSETGLADDVFPPECPYTFDDLMTRDIPWPSQD